MSVKYLWIAIILSVLSMGLAILPRSVSHYIPFKTGLIANLAHIPLFALITFIWIRAIIRSKPWQIRKNLMLFFVTVIGIIILAGITEAIQEFVSGRTSSVYDFLLDVIGISIGACGGFLYQRRVLLSRDDILD